MKLSDYKKSFVLRRISMGKRDVDVVSIGYSGFFRSWRTFMVLERLISGIKGPLKIWVPGCAGGEEAYTIAAILEGLGHENYTIFATDINKNLIRKARAGVYPIIHLKEIPKRFLNSFFKVDNGVIRPMPTKGKIIWGTHDLLEDPYLINIDILSCRNFIMYLSRDSQIKVIGRFIFSLKKGAYLILGDKERVPDKLLPYFEKLPDVSIYILRKKAKFPPNGQLFD